MSSSKKEHHLVHRKSFAAIHKLKAGVCLLGFLVILISGLSAQVSLTTIIFRSTLVILAVILISRVVIQVLITYEEMNGGKG